MLEWASKRFLAFPASQIWEWRRHILQFPDFPILIQILGEVCSPPETEVTDKR
jgi:hypothetical protein